ncbi:thioesterase domain-containing protein [Streptomyces sp. 549]|uniref:thioesterase II family protein n=1 Tax=Streptomyces sp. 549 TaxID=3049076 RepID=UPI0024C39E70|nr:thioesterase domain-containing protein [Streptomyces sp. 549]MDK1476855.1 thioesterase domain-containing protein [Streptomyces sp. 549]
MSGWWMTVGNGARRAVGAGPGPGPRRRPRFRVVALPHAGGWPSAFRSWWQVLPDDVECVVAQLPGRGARINEPPLTRVEPQVDALSRSLAELEPLPYAVIGHSFGSVLGYELTRAMEQKELPPALLAVSARQPPCFPSEPPFAHLRSDTELLEHLVDIGGLSPGLMDRADLIRLSLRAIRADLEAMETYQRPWAGTRVPILALSAVDDPVVIDDRMHLWSLETSGGFSRQTFTGGHFYLYTPANAAAVAARLVPGLRDPAGASPPTSPPDDRVGHR